MSYLGKENVEIQFGQLNRMILMNLINQQILRKKFNYNVIKFYRFFQNTPSPFSIQMMKPTFFFIFMILHLPSYLLNNMYSIINNKSSLIKLMAQSKQTNSQSFPPQNIQNHSTTTSTNSPNNKNMKKKKRQAQLFAKRVSKQHYNNSLWTLKENKAYMIFLEQNLALFSLGNIQKRDIKINVLMSKRVSTRSPDQCRSHHQKMIKYHKNIPSIIEYITNLQASKKQTPSTCERNDETEYQLKDLMYIEWPLVQESFCQLLMNYKQT